MLYEKRSLTFNPLSVTTEMKVIAWVFELGKTSQLEFLHANKFYKDRSQLCTVELDSMEATYKLTESTGCLARL